MEGDLMHATVRRRKETHVPQEYEGNAAKRPAAKRVMKSRSTSRTPSESLTSRSVARGDSRYYAVAGPSSSDVALELLNTTPSSSSSAAVPAFYDDSRTVLTPAASSTSTASATTTSAPPSTPDYHFTRTMTATTSSTSSASSAWTPSRSSVAATSEEVSEESGGWRRGLVGKKALKSATPALEPAPTWFHDLPIDLLANIFSHFSEKFPSSHLTLLLTFLCVSLSCFYLPSHVTTLISSHVTTYSSRVTIHPSSRVIRLPSSQVTRLPSYVTILSSSHVTLLPSSLVNILPSSRVSLLSSPSSVFVYLSLVFLYFPLLVSPYLPLVGRDSLPGVGGAQEVALQLALVCRRWRAAAKHPRLWRRLEFAGSRVATSVVCRLLRTAPLLLALRLDAVPNASTIVRQLCR
ncbi:Protein of unknown function [Gryllus bimaculatus]|nr:Protein of unknown function [Gryllus bimaculatus]